MYQVYYTDSAVYLFPFSSIPFGSNVIIYGAGVIGRQYVEQIHRSGDYHLLCVVDRNWKKLSVPYVDVLPVEEVTKMDAYVVLASDDSKIFDSMKRQLEDLGIKKDYIVHRIIKCNMFSHAEFSCNFTDTHYTLEELTVSQRSYLDKLHKLLKIAVLRDTKDFVRIGRNYDGGYLLIDDFHAKKIAYSFGISSDTSFDNDMVNRGFEVYMYDHTIEPPTSLRKGMHFFRTGIGYEGEKNTETLERLVEKNNHSKLDSMILKMDVEGAEWDFLRHVDPDLLSKFDQVVLELHWLLNFEASETILSCLEKLNQTHQVVHVHANNCNNQLLVENKGFANVLEITCVNRKNHEFQFESSCELPHRLDMPNNVMYRDISLDYWGDQLNLGVDSID